MKYETLKGYDDKKFRRITGVKKTTFGKMAEILSAAEAIRRSKGGPKPSLSVEDMLLATLEYLREYRTYFHIGTSYGVSESSAYKTVRWIEDTLIKHPDFALPGKKALIKSDSVIDIVLMVGSSDGALSDPDTFPSPATSNTPCGFPAVCFPVIFASKFM
jgi:hypothetical protein